MSQDNYKTGRFKAADLEEVGFDDLHTSGPSNRTYQNRGNGGRFNKYGNSGPQYKRGKRRQTISRYLLEKLLENKDAALARYNEAITLMTPYIEDINAKRGTSYIFGENMAPSIARGDILALCVSPYNRRNKGDRNPDAPAPKLKHPGQVMISVSSKKFGYLPWQQLSDYPIVQAFEFYEFAKDVVNTLNRIDTRAIRASMSPRQGPDASSSSSVPLDGTSKPALNPDDLPEVAKGGVPPEVKA